MDVEWGGGAGRRGERQNETETQTKMEPAIHKTPHK